MSNESKALMPTNKGLAIQQKRNIKRIGDGFKRVGKVMLNSGLSVVTFGAAAIIGGPLAFPVGVGASAILAANAYQEARYNRTKNSMFMIKRNINGEVTLSQDALKSASKIKGFEPHEKGATMGLEMLVGLENYKQQFEDKKKQIAPSRNESEYGVYPTVFATKTHGINIKTIEALENLGYLQIESKEPKNKSLLLVEKIGFKQYNEAKEAAVAKIKSDEETLKKHQKQMYEIKFKLTDKPVDLEGLYKNYLQLKETRERTQNRKDIMRIGAILQSLENRNIDLERDNLGVLQIKYGAKEAFAKRVEREKQIGEADEKFRESLRENVETEIIQQRPETERTQQVEKEQDEGR